MIKTYCLACFKTKDPIRITDSYCQDCQTNLDQAVEAATREGRDTGDARRNALASRAPHPQAGRDPRGYTPRFFTRDPLTGELT